MPPPDPALTAGSAAAPAPPKRDQRTQELRIGGRPYVLVPKPDFDRLLEEADQSRGDAAAFASTSVGRDLRSRRHAARLTLAQTARQAGIALETLSRIENGRTNPSISTVQAILKVLDRNGKRTTARNDRLLGLAPGPADVARADPALIRTVRDELAERLNAHMFQSRLAAIVESSDDAIISKALDGTITSWNAGAERLFGYTAAEIVGQPIFLIVPDERRNEEHGILAKIARGERIRHFETVRRRKNGSLVDISLSISPIRDEDGNVVGAAKIARDVTELKRHREETRRATSILEEKVRERTRSLQDTIQELDSFAYTVAHDLRAPLRAVHSFGEILLEELAATLTPLQAKYLHEMVNAGARMDTLISDLLAYSRISRQETPLDTIDLTGVVDRVLGDLHNELHAVAAIVEVRRPLPKVAGNAVLLHQALTNLISNAVKFIEPGKTPRVLLLAERYEDGIGGRVRVWVEDNGIGIAQEHQSRLFKVFERLHARDAYPGTGIGLAIVRRAVERMGGTSGLESAPGIGSRFWIDLHEAQS